MRKLLSTLLLTLCAIHLSAQTNAVIFVDKDGNEIGDGTTITVNTPTTDDFGITIIPSGIYVKNTMSDDTGIHINYNIQTLENGSLQICFPMTCVSNNASGAFKTDNGMMTGNETRDLQTEWLPDTYGKCTVNYQIELMKQTSVFPPKYESIGMGPKITINYVYSDPAGINDINGDSKATIMARYDTSGRRLTDACRGLNIVKTSDGKVIKQIVR